MTSASRQSDDSTTDVQQAAEALSEDLDSWSQRLDDPSRPVDRGRCTPSRVPGDGARRAAAAPWWRRTTRGLAALYESPLDGHDLDRALDAMAERASVLREQAWERAKSEVPLIEPATGEPVLSDTPVEAAEPAPTPTDVPLSDDTPAPEAPASPRPDRLAIVVEVLTVLGVLMVVFAVYTIWGTGLSAAQSQRELRREFDVDLRSATAVSTEGDVQESGILVQASDESSAAEEEADEVDPATTIDPGRPVAILSLPTIGSRQIVVEGTRSEDLRAGPGHLRSTPLPGQAGNAVVFGRRTTYGAPFADLDDLRPGDPMDVTTTDGLFQYVVQDVRRVGPGDPDPITATFSNRLTLVTSDEHYSSAGRFIVYGVLDGPPVPSPTTASGDLVPLPVVNPDEIGTQRTTVDWALVLLWTQLLAGTYFATRWLYQSWRPWSTWLVTAPVFLLVALAWMDSLTRLFPSTL